MLARSALLTVILALAASAPASTQDAPPSLWDSAAAPEAGGAARDGGRSAVLLGLGLIALAGAGGVALLAVRAPASGPHVDPSRNGSGPARFAAGGAERPPGFAPGGAERAPGFAPGGAEHPPEFASGGAEPPPRRDWQPLPVAGPPPRPAFGPGASAAPPAAPPPPDA
jgi:hypothetical protein